MRAISPGKFIELFLRRDEKNVNSGNPKLPVNWRFPSDMKPGRLWSVSFFFFFPPPVVLKDIKWSRLGLGEKQTGLGFTTASGG